MVSDQTEVQPLLQTPLFPLHEDLGAKMVGFAGWAMPVQYPAGIIAEHRACRTSASLFDVSHMGQVIVRGEGAAAKFEGLAPGGLTTLKPGHARYTQLTTPEGGIYDDLIVTNAEDHLFVVVNASMKDQDIGLMRKGLDECEIEVLEDRALVALQGPATESILDKIVPGVSAMRFMQSAEFGWNGQILRVSRLGYTGEDGYEISVPAAYAERFARTLIEDGRVSPAGLGARDTLRMEAGLPLYGNDIDQSTSPVEAGLGFSIPKRRRENGGFPGAERIASEAANGATRRLVGLLPDGRAPARAGVEVTAEDGTKLGSITSGGFSPTLERPISLGYVAASHAEAGQKVNLMLRGKPVPATVSTLPFVAQNYKR
jgi:aminomethyltransferase